MCCEHCGFAFSTPVRFCPSCGAQYEGSGPEDRPVRSASRRVAGIVFPVVLIVGVIVFVQYLDPSIHQVIKAQPIVAGPREYDSTTVTMKTVAFREDSGDILFPLSDLLEHRLITFEYNGGTTPRPVMAYVAPTGHLVTAMSVSEHCGSTEFLIRSNRISCARCPSTWDMITMEAFACCAKYHPDPIPSRVVNDTVRVAKAFVEKWASRL